MVNFYSPVVVYAALALLSRLILALPSDTSSLGVRDHSELLAQKVTDSRREDRERQTTEVGGPHGSPFNDKSFAVDKHRRVASVTLFGCSPEHITKYAFYWRDNTLPKNPVTPSFHGKDYAGEPSVTLKLAVDEYITRVDMSTWRTKFALSKRTRLGWIKLTTSGHQIVECGAKSADDPAFYWEYKDYALLYLSGTAGEAIDSLSGHFIPVEDYL